MIKVNWDTLNYEEKQKRVDEIVWKLDNAFTTLSNKNIVGIQNYLCCTNCGKSGMHKTFGKSCMRGYVFYHKQDREDLEARGEVHLAYGAFDETKHKSEDIGKEICEALKDAGIEFEWTCNSNQKILVKVGFI